MRGEKRRHYRIIEERKRTETYSEQFNKEEQKHIQNTVQQQTTLHYSTTTIHIHIFSSTATASMLGYDYDIYFYNRTSIRTTTIPLFSTYTRCPPFSTTPFFSTSPFCSTTLPTNIRSSSYQPPLVPPSFIVPLFIRTPVAARRVTPLVCSLEDLNDLYLLAAVHYAQ